MAAAEGGDGGGGVQKHVYKRDLDTIRDFLMDYVEDIALPGQPRQKYRKYAEQIYEIRNRTRGVLDIKLDDVKLTLDEEFLVSVEGNTHRYLKLFYDAVDGILKDQFKKRVDVLEEEDNIDFVQRIHRESQYAEIKRGQGEEPAEAEMEIPAALTRLYELRITPRTREAPPLKLREVSGSSLGHLVQVQAMVLRATDVKPLMTVATFSCDRCGYELYQPVVSKQFMPTPACSSEVCTANGVRGKVHMHPRRSKFTKYQELRIQELPEHVPAGSIPRTMTVICKGASTREVKAGDQVLVGGIFLPTPYTGMQAIKAGLTTDTYLEAQSLVCLKKGEADGMDAATAALIEEVSQQDAYSLLARSIAPEIFGLEDVKKVLLLQLIGGVTRQQGDGMKTRGDINVCLMGDPGVAKSQLLKHIAKIAPRCVYTTGKGSSGVGLTAAVVRDPMTGELTLEGGALVLADMGICCIDEFDKMDETDRTAIHEVMEQQTVSIAKAGITTTLNARTAILAAANPKYGRYNRLADRDAHTALQKNINLPAALLSRFDLMFLLLDETDRDNDLGLAEHITYVHQHEKHPPLGFKPFDPIFIRQFISVVRTFVPSVPPELRDYIVEAYVDIRSKDKQRSIENNSRATTTARQLLSILRLAEAHCKLNFRNTVQQVDVDEAIRLIQMSKASVMESDSDLVKNVKSDPVSRIWNLVCPKLNSGFIAYDEAQNIAQRSGFTQDDFVRFLMDYESLNVIQVNASRTRIDLVSSGL